MNRIPLHINMSSLGSEYIMKYKKTLIFLTLLLLYFFIGGPMADKMLMKSRYFMNYEDIEIVGHRPYDSFRHLDFLNYMKAEQFIEYKHDQHTGFNEIALQMQQDLQLESSTKFRTFIKKTMSFRMVIFYLEDENLFFIQKWQLDGTIANLGE